MAEFPLPLQPSRKMLNGFIDSIEDGYDGTFEAYDEVIKNIDKAMEDEDYETDFTDIAETASSATDEKSEDSASEAESEAEEPGTESSEFFHDSQTIKIQTSEIEAILQSLDKLIMRQIKLKNEIDFLKKSGNDSEFQAYQELSENIAVLESQSIDIQKSIIALRMLPFDMILRPIKRSILSESLKMGKNIDFDIPQSDITIDKSIWKSFRQFLSILYETPWTTELNLLKDGKCSARARKAKYQSA